ncbi:MAG: hypothetical protein AAAFM81_04585 [Pseudomonadota bacterium]
MNLQRQVRLLAFSFGVALVALEMVAVSLLKPVGWADPSHPTVSIHLDQAFAPFALNDFGVVSADRVCTHVEAVL